jgi:hypothetical protein
LASVFWPNARSEHYSYPLFGRFLEEAFSEVRVLERLGQPLGSAHTSQQKKIARISRKAEVAHKELHIHASGLSPWSNTTPTMKPLNTATDVKRPRQNR